MKEDLCPTKSSQNFRFWTHLVYEMKVLHFDVPRNFTTDAKRERRVDHKIEKIPNDRVILFDLNNNTMVKSSGEVLLSFILIPNAFHRRTWRV